MTQVHVEPTPSMTIEDCRQDFPALQQDINGQPLVFLDSAASSQAPQSVIDAVANYQKHDHANVHRGVHTLSHRATDAYEGARDKIQGFIGKLACKGKLRILFGREMVFNVVVSEGMHGALYSPVTLIDTIIACSLTCTQRSRHRSDQLS